MARILLERLPEEKKRLFELKWRERERRLTSEGIACRLHISRNTFFCWRRGIVTAVAIEMGLVDATGADGERIGEWRCYQGLLRTPRVLLLPRTNPSPTTYRWVDASTPSIYQVVWNEYQACVEDTHPISEPCSIRSEPQLMKHGFRTDACYYEHGNIRSLKPWRTSLGKPPEKDDYDRSPCQHNEDGSVHDGIGGSLHIDKCSKDLVKDGNYNCCHECTKYAVR